QTGVLHGEDWKAKIGRAIQHNRVLVCLYSPNFFSGSWERQIRLAHSPTSTKRLLNRFFRSSETSVGDILTGLLLWTSAAEQIAARALFHNTSLQSLRAPRRHANIG